MEKGKSKQQSMKYFYIYIWFYARRELIPNLMFREICKVYI